MEFTTKVKLAVYRHFAETGAGPTVDDVAMRVHSENADVLEAYRSLRDQRVLVLEQDGSTIRMAPPFSGVPTLHLVKAGTRQYYANCAWDALGIPAALHAVATIHSRCGQSGEPLLLNVDLNGPEPSSWLFHCLVPAAHWWDDVVFT